VRVSPKFFFLACAPVPIKREDRGGVHVCTWKKDMTGVMGGVGNVCVIGTGVFNALKDEFEENESF